MSKETHSFSVSVACVVGERAAIMIQHNCIVCGRKLPKEDSDLINMYGVDPYCSQYCAEIGSGVPMPYSQGANVFDKFWNEKA